MRIPRLSRKQKILRNFLAAALCLFLMAWQQGFPVRSHEALLQRAAGDYLIEAPVELLFVDEEEQTVYGAVEGRLLKVTHGGNLFGMQISDAGLYPAEKQYVVSYKTFAWDRETDTYSLQFKRLVAGNLGDAATGEMDFAVELRDGITHQADWQGTVTITGTREGKHHMRFPAVEDERDATHAYTRLSALRLYDENGDLLEEKHYTLEELLEEG